MLFTQICFGSFLLNKTFESQPHVVKCIQLLEHNGVNGIFLHSTDVQHVLSSEVTVQIPGMLAGIISPHAAEIEKGV
jgi:hypothetical protein